MAEWDPDPSLAAARATLRAYEPPDEQQADFRAHLLAWIERFPADAHRRTRREGHLTASVLLVDARGARVLLHHHRKLERWLQFGGHCDGDGNFRAVARRELVEESGVEPAWLSPAPVDLDVHRIPARADEPEHDHLDVRFLARAGEGARAQASEESNELRWFRWEELPALDLDPSLARLIALARARGA